MILTVNSDHSVEQRQQINVLKVTGCVLFEVRTEFLNII
jgi:hypothetical protein